VMHRNVTRWALPLGLVVISSCPAGATCAIETARELGRREPARDQVDEPDAFD
jgi:hypothetical protein